MLFEYFVIDLRGFILFFFAKKERKILTPPFKIKEREKTQHPPPKTKQNKKQTQEEDGRLKKPQTFNTDTLFYSVTV